MFEKCIIYEEEAMKVTYDYEVLEHYSAEKHKTVNTQISGSATNLLGVSLSTPQTTCPSWLSHMDQRKHEKKDDVPNHPLVLMVNMQACSNYHIISESR